LLTAAAVIADDEAGDDEVLRHAWSETKVSRFIDEHLCSVSRSVYRDEKVALYTG